MAYRQYLDGNGSPITIYEKDGRLFPNDFPAKHWQGINNLKSRDDDVLICGYPKSGLHWMWEIVTMLKNNKSQVSMRRMEEQGILMLTTQRALNRLPSPRTLTTHRRFCDLPSDFISKRRKMVVILRDPRDVCVSYYHMQTSIQRPNYVGTFQGFVPLFLRGHVPFNSWAGWIQSFEKGLKEHPELSVHVVHYEHLKANPVKEIERLAVYLGCSTSLAETVTTATQFSSMKTVKEALPNPFAVYYKNKVDTIFRKGETGEWRHYFTEEQAREFENQLQKDLGRLSTKAKL